MTRWLWRGSLLLLPLAIAARVVEEFEVDLATAEHDAAEFVREMLQGGLLLPGDGASA